MCDTSWVDALAQEKQHYVRFVIAQMDAQVVVWMCLCVIVLQFFTCVLSEENQHKKKIWTNDKQSNQHYQVLHGMPLAC